ncbi:hypothetical protein LCGC14_1745500 [marine sediment metagenome]|uniref:HicB-like antitoxin of toxin-antitoxin system domain-containing protein n=1 Tax=marine sediment metagenome TaxID=412755 RepID=A0A0F9K515_9ZZZZ
MDSYIIELSYSEEDEGYIAVVPKLPGCSAFGKTRKEALQEIEVAIELRLKVMKSEPDEMEKSDFSPGEDEKFKYVCTDIAIENPDKTEVAVISYPR